MNIHETDITTLEKLKNLTITSVEFGSHLYGLNTSESDTDIFHIYNKTDNMNKSIIKRFNNIQFKQDNTDSIFCTLDDFILDLINGGSTVSFEVLHLLKDTKLNWIYEIREMFYNYENIRSYLGVAKRDCKLYKQSPKKLSHAYRSVLYAHKILSGEFNFNFSEDEFKTLQAFRHNISTDADRKTILKLAEELRNVINELNDKKEIKRLINVNDYNILDYNLKVFKRNVDNTVSYMNLDIFYDSIVNGVTYK